MTKNIRDLPDAVEHSDELAQRLAGRRPAVFLDYDGTLTPIVDRPEDAVISESMRNAVRELAKRCPVCVVSGRDRRVVQELMGVDDLIVAGSHGFDIWSPAGGEIQREEGANFAELLEGVEVCLREALGLDGDDVAPMYLGDDLTDEDAFEALNEASPRGIGIFVGRVDDPEVAGRTTAADYVLDDVREVERFLNALAH